jgi:hypothetical protein
VGKKTVIGLQQEEANSHPMREKSKAHQDRLDHEANGQVKRKLNVRRCSRQVYLDR